MNTELLDKYVVDVLRKHGWSEGRKRDITYWIRVLTEEGYIVNDYAKSVLEELGDIHMNTRSYKRYCGVQLDFDPVYGGSGEYDRLEIFNAAAKEELFPIGECFSWIVYVGASKKVYLGDWASLSIAGDSIEEFLNNAFTCGPLREIYTNEEGPW